MDKHTRIKIEILAIIFLIAGTSLMLYFVGAEKIVSTIGVHNTYLVAFLVALLGGMTSIGGVSYTATIITFVAGGANPLFIALAAGAGTGLGDTLYYMVARHSSKIVKKGWLKDKLTYLSNWLSKHSDLTKFVGIYLYAALTPLPNDPLTITLGLSRVHKYIVIPALVLGDTTFAFLLAYFGRSLPFV